MYVWGSGASGALGLGKDDDEPRPTILKIRDYSGKVQRIVQIACGRYHSMCLTEKNEIFSWGEGSFGRLGLGDEGDVDVPTKVY